MTFLTRRILFITFLLAFLVITPLLILYASGYKINFGNGIKPNLSLQKTGMLILDTKPQGAKIYLNGKSQQLFLKKYYSKGESYITTPTKVKNLLPGEYEVKIELPGYWPWQKKLTVRGGASTYAEDVILFKNNLPFFLTGSEESGIFPSPDKKYIAVADNGVKIFDTATDEITDFDFAQNTFFSWSPDGKKIIAGYKIFNLNGKEEINLSGYFGATKIKFKWGEKGKLYYALQNNIYEFDPGEKKSILIVSGEGKIIDFLVKENISFVEKNGGKVKLNVAEIDSKKILKSIDLPSFSGYHFINGEHKFLNLYDSEHEILYLIDPFSYLITKEIINNFKDGYWADEGRLIYSNDFEIWIYYAASRQKILLTRLSTPIEKVIWHPSNNYIIYSAGNVINAMELDDREKRITTELIRLDKISDIILNKKGDILYFYAEIGNQQGLYKLAIQ